MRNCKYCGTDYNDDVEACPSCGLKFSAGEVVQKVESQKEVEIDTNKSKKKNILFGIIAVVLVCVIAAIANITINNEVYIYADNSGREVEITHRETKDSIEHGTSYIEQGEYLSAIDEFKKVSPEHKSYNSAQTQIQTATEGYSNDIAVEIDRLLSGAHYQEAIEVLNSAEATVGNNSILSVKRGEVLDCYRIDFIVRADKYAEENNFTGSFDILKEAELVTGKTDTLVQKHLEITEAYKADFINRSQVHLSNKDYIEALAILTTAQGIFGVGDTEVADVIFTVNKSRVVEKIAEYEQAQDYVTAITYIDKEFKFIENDAQILEKLNSFKGKYKERILAAAYEAYINEGYQAAVSILQDASKVISNDDELSATQKAYSNCEPVYLSTLEAYETSSWAKIGVSLENYTRDNYLTVYDGNHVLTSSQIYYVGNIKYYVNKEYNKLTGVCYVPYATRNDNYAGSAYLRNIQVYGDGALLYEKTGGTNSDQPFEVSVDITGVEFLTINISSSGLCFGNVAISKDLKLE